MLRAPAIKAWLGGVEPAWALLDQASFWALRRRQENVSGRSSRKGHFDRKTALFDRLL